MATSFIGQFQQFVALTSHEGLTGNYMCLTIVKLDGHLLAFSHIQVSTWKIAREEVEESK